MDDKVSIVIPCYNHARFLGEAIESALNQTASGVEVVVVDDGSTDNTVEVAKRYPVILISRPNRGVSASRNDGILLAKGDRILPLDADDKIHHMYVEHALMRDRNSIIRVGMREFGDRDNYLEPWTEKTVEQFVKGNKGFVCSMFPKEAWEKVGGYDENMKIGFEDWDFWVRIMHAGYKWDNINEELFYYRRHGTTMSTSAGANAEEIMAYIKKKWEGMGIC